jgi:hypothetical protein
MSKRAVGYCYNNPCDDVSKGVFLLNHGDTFYCPRCRLPGTVEREVGEVKGEGSFFRQVRVEFNYNPQVKKYLEAGIVAIENVSEGNTYTLRSPLIKTEQRALKVAEQVLANLNCYGHNPSDTTPTQELILMLDDDRESFTRSCDKLRQLLEKSSLVDKDTSLQERTT